MLNEHCWSQSLCESGVKVGEITVEVGINIIHSCMTTSPTVLYNWTASSTAD